MTEVGRARPSNLSAQDAACGIDHLPPFVGEVVEAGGVGHGGLEGGDLRVAESEGTGLGSLKPDDGRGGLRTDLDLGAVEHDAARIAAAAVLHRSIRRHGIGGGRIRADRAARAAAAGIDESDVIAADVALHGVIGLALRRQAQG